MKNKRKGYLIVFTVILSLARVVNELAAGISSSIQSSVVNEFFVARGMSYEEGLAAFTLLGAAAGLLSVLSFFYKPLADRIGRKRILCLNTLGVALGMTVCFFSGSALIYCLGVGLYTFFLQNDLQMIYILESAPEGRGGRLFGLIKAIGILGLVNVPLLRDTVMHNEAARWRSLFGWPALLGFLIVAALMLFAKETVPGTAGRPAVKVENAPEAAPSGGIGRALKRILGSRTLRGLVIAYTLYGLCAMAAYMYVESLMTQSGLTTVEVTRALYVYPFVYALLSFSGGRLADRFGRRTVISASAALCALGFVFFILVCRTGGSPWLVGLMNGVYLGSYWVTGDYISVLITEQAPPELRASVLSASGVLSMGGIALGMGLQLLLMLWLGLVPACLLVLVPAMLGCSALIFVNGKRKEIA